MKPPVITFKPHHVLGDYTWPYLCTIHEGPGHHGVGETPARALFNAAWAWNNYEEHKREKDVN